MRQGGLRCCERSLVCACAAPAASLPVAVEVRQNVAALADSPALDELSVELSSECGSVTLELIVSGHCANGSARPRHSAPPPLPPALARALA